MASALGLYWLGSGVKCLAGVAAAMTAEELTVQRQSLLSCWIGCPERKYDCKLWNNSTDILEGWPVDYRSDICGYKLKTGKVVVIFWKVWHQGMM